MARTPVGRLPCGRQRVGAVSKGDDLSGALAMQDGAVVQAGRDHVAAQQDAEGAGQVLEHAWQRD